MSEHVVHRYGREIVLTLGDELDFCGQFLVSVAVDGKEAFACMYTDKTPDYDPQGADGEYWVNDRTGEQVRVTTTRPAVA